MTSDPARRLERIYGRYRRSRRRRRAWAADNPGNVAIRGELFELLLREGGDRLGEGTVLDVGCGGGWLLARLAEAGVEPSRLHGIELIESRMAAAREAVPGAEIRRADACALPYGDRSFDLVLMLTVLSSMPDPEAVRVALGEARRVLAPGGLLLVYEPLLPNPFNRATRLVRRRDLDRGLGAGWEQRRLTVAPPLARALGPIDGNLYDRLRRLRPLLTHRLVVHRALAE